MGNLFRMGDLSIKAGLKLKERKLRKTGWIYPVVMSIKNKGLKRKVLDGQNRRVR